MLFQRVVPAKAGTDNHRRSLLQKVSPTIA
jgi:hypothetical protein